MGVLRIDCPRCGLGNQSCEIKAERKFKDRHRNLRQFTVVCGGCNNWILIDAELPASAKEETDFGKMSYEIRRDYFRQFRTWPPTPIHSAPDHTPPEVDRAYTQAMKALHRKDWDAAGMMARKALELATAQLGEFTRADSLKRRIKSLGDSYKITPQLVEWADAIREDGNDAAHDDFTEAEAKEICEFAETFLEYVFTMPGKLAARKAEFDQEKREG
jgi:hypothetical protein